MPANRLALQDIGDAFSLNDLHQALADMYDQSFGQSSYWRAMMATAGAPGASMPQSGPYSASHLGGPAAAQPAPSDAWLQQMARAGAPGLEGQYDITPADVEREVAGQQDRLELTDVLLREKMGVDMHGQPTVNKPVPYRRILPGELAKDTGVVERPEPLWEGRTRGPAEPEPYTPGNGRSW